MNDCPHLHDSYFRPVLGAAVTGCWWRASGRVCVLVVVVVAGVRQDPHSSLMAPWRISIQS